MKRHSEYRPSSPSLPFPFRAALAMLVLTALGCDSPRTALTAPEQASPAPPAETASDPGAETSAMQMAVAAERFLDALSPEQRELVQFPFDADSVRTHWSNLPSMFVERQGLRFGDLDDRQRRLAHALLRASTSSQGYQKIAGVMRLEDVLHEWASGAEERGERKLPDELIESWTSRNYWLTLFGAPAPGTTWGWQLSGHHLGANFTVVDNRLSFTPLFLGAEPNEIQTGSEAGWKVLSHEGERGYELLRALDEGQLDRAVLGGKIPGDVLTGPGRKGSLETFAGLPASEMSGAQQELLWALVREAVANVDHDAAKAQLSRIEADGLDRLHFAWIGPQHDITARYYYRLHGPSVLIEYVVEEGVGGEAANHVHCIVRDPANDYGEDWLGKHYEEHHRRIR